jgi:hypothetical protein
MYHIRRDFAAYLASFSRLLSLNFFLLLRTHSRSVPAEKLDFMASMFRYVPLRAGQRLFEEGELGLSMYIVLRCARFGYQRT